MLKSEFIPVAIDQAYQRRQKDTEGALYRKIAGQGPRKNFAGTTQGLYLATANGKLLAYNNNRGSDRIKRLMRDALAQPAPDKVVPVEKETLDPRYNPQLPEGGLIVRVHAKVLDGYEPTDDKWRQIFQTAIARDNLWISKSEHQMLAGGEIPKTMQRRIARFHLVDNTRGEPPMWKDSEIRSLEMSVEDGVVSGHVSLQTEDGRRGYDAKLKGELAVEEDKVIRFDVVALGKHWGEGRYTGGAPKGKFPLAVTFELADGSDVADAIPPQGSRGWLAGYLSEHR